MSLRIRQHHAGPAGNPEPSQCGQRVAAVQMASGPSVAANLTGAAALIRLAADQGARLVALPEYFALMGLRDTDKVRAAESLDNGPIQAFLSRSARDHSVWLVGGTLPLKSELPGKVRNACLVFNDQGERVARYDKIHLFGFQMGTEHYQESTTITPGDAVVTLDTPVGRVGLAVCYDLRFPELFRRMPGVDLIVIPSAFTETTGRAHWEPLLRARAIENLCYVMAPAQGGYHLSGRETHGNSMIIDPWGQILDRLPRGSGVVLADVDADHIARLRQSLPALSHRTLV